MSWSQFKDEVGSRMKEANWKTSDEWAKFFTKKYDECIKRGTDLSGKNPVLKGNTELMEQTLINAGNIALAAKSPAFYGTYLNLLTDSIVSLNAGFANLNSSNLITTISLIIFLPFYLYFQPL